MTEALQPNSAIESSRSCEGKPSARPRRLMESRLGTTPTVAAFAEILPASNTKRWVIRRKAAVVAAVRSGQITIEEACCAYQLSVEEFLSWQRAFESHGLPGLRVTRIQQYREARSEQLPLLVAQT